MADLKHYRHTKTGLVGVYPPRLAAVFSDVLTEVEPGAKPLAYVSIPAEVLPVREHEDAKAPSAEVVAEAIPKPAPTKKKD